MIWCEGYNSISQWSGSWCILLPGMAAVHLVSSFVPASSVISIFAPLQSLQLSFLPPSIHTVRLAPAHLVRSRFVVLCEASCAPVPGAPPASVCPSAPPFSAPRLSASPPPGSAFALRRAQVSTTQFVLPKLQALSAPGLFRWHLTCVCVPRFYWV